MLSLFDHGPFPPCPAPFNMAAYVLAQAGKQPGKTALKIVSHKDSQSWSYRVLNDAVCGTARGLLETGAQPQDLILLRLGNTVDFPLAYLGALAAGMVPVPTSAALSTTEVQRILEELSPRLILRDPCVPCPDAGQQICLEDLQAMRHLPPAPFHMGDPERTGYVVYTSGTSGKPRAVAHAHRAIWARRMMFEGWYGLHSTDRLLHAGAFNWTYTMGTGLMDPWTIGATALIPASGTRSADLPALLAQHKATLFAAAPGVYRQLLRTASDDHLSRLKPHLKRGLSAGEKLPQSIARHWQEKTGTPVLEAFGMSECSTFISSSPQNPASHNRLGRPQRGRRIAILDPENPAQPPRKRGEPGLIAIHQSDPGLMLGYLNAPEETKLKMQGEWFLTGDLGILHEDEQISYLGRNDDMMNAGGYRVSPLEVEQAFSGFPGLNTMAVTQVEIKPDTFVIAAFYTSTAPLDEAALDSHARKNLARYKQPRLYQREPDLPQGANGKILRKALRERFVSQHSPLS